jgi:hypothetical protein
VTWSPEGYDRKEGKRNEIKQAKSSSCGIRGITTKESKTLEFSSGRAATELQASTPYEMGVGMGAEKKMPQT